VGVGGLMFNEIKYDHKEQQGVRLNMNKGQEEQQHCLKKKKKTTTKIEDEKEEREGSKNC